MTLLLLLACVLTLAWRANAQVPFDTCRDRDDQPIPGVVDNTIADVGMATLRNEHPIILWNDRANRRLPRTEQLFIYLHECAHHTLGHVYRRGGGAREELEADCRAIQQMVDGDMVRTRQLNELERARRTVRGDDVHLGGEEHIRSLADCLRIRTDPEAWASALDTLVLAAQDGFATRRGRTLDSTGTYRVHEALLDLPGTYDCEVVGASLGCLVFSTRKQGAATDRYRALSKILENWLPEGWTSTERASSGVENDRTWLGRDGRTGTRLTLSLTGTQVYLRAEGSSR